MKVEEGGISGGVWEALVTATEPPVIEALHGGRVVEGVQVRPVPGQPGRFALRVPIPAWVLNEGLQTILVQSGGQTLARVVTSDSSSADFTASQSAERPCASR